MKLLFFHLSYFSIAFSTAFIILVIVWMNYPYKLIEWSGISSPIVTKTIKQGGIVKYKSDYCKYTDIQPTVTRIFKNGILFYTPTTIGATTKGCFNTTIAVPIPPELPPGKYILINIYDYKVNPVRSIKLTRRTDEFIVIEATDSSQIK